MKFAFETVIWGRRLDDLRAVLEVISKCGYKGVEIAQRPEEMFVRQEDGTSKSVKELGAVEFVAILKEYDLHLVGLAGGTLRERIDFCGTQVRPDFLYIEDLEEDNAVLLAALTASPPHTLALQPHWLKRLERIADARKVIKDKLVELKAMINLRGDKSAGKGLPGANADLDDYIKLLPDTAHLTIVGDDLRACIPNHAEIAALHVKDWTPSYGRYSHRYAQGFVPLGEGQVEFEGVLDSLRWRGYKGWVVVVQDVAEGEPAHAAWHGAKWLVGWLKKNSCPVWTIPEWKELASLHMEAKPDTVTGTAAERELDFLRRVMLETTRGPERFYQAVTDALRKLWNFITVQVYSYHPISQELYLLGASGILGNYDILDTRKSLCGEVTRQLVPMEFDLTDPKLAIVFRDKPLLKRLYNLHSENQTQKVESIPMVSMPVYNASKSQHLRYVLNMFPRKASDVDMEEMTRVGAHISWLADRVSGEACLDAAVDTAFEGSKLTTKVGYLDRIRNLIVKKLRCRAVTILLQDETGERLRVASTTGVEWNSDLRAHERHYRKGQGQTGRVWATGEMLLLSDNRSHLSDGTHPARSWEVGEDVTCRECLYAPLGRSGSSPIGVVRITGKWTTSAGRGTSMFTYDDAAILDAILQTALPQIEILALQKLQLRALTRMTHEFKTPLLAINGTVDRIRQLLKKAGQDPATMFPADYFDDILNWSKIMGSQAQNAKIFSASPTGGVEPNLSRVLRMAEVIMPVVEHLSRTMYERGIASRSIEVGDFRDIPPLWVDQSQLQQVFFNLLANAIKYREKSRPFRVKIDGGRHGSAFIIWFSDWGMGVPPGLEEAIFDPGFRAEEAMLRDVSGQGIGLAVVRTILRAHGNASIELKNHSQPTRFEIVLPDRLTYADWQKRSADTNPLLISEL